MSKISGIKHSAEVNAHYDALDSTSPLVAVIGAPFETGNHGVSALASGTISAIRKGLPNARIVILDYGKVPTVWNEHTDAGTVQVGLVNLRFSKRLLLPNNIARLILLAGLIRLVPIKSWRRRLAQRSRWLGRIAKSDFNLALNGGDSFSDIYGLSRLAYVILPQLVVLLLERPLILLPQTHGPFKTGLARRAARHLLRRAKLIYSRDREGLEVVRGLLGNRSPHLRFAYDMGFALEPLPPTQEVRERITQIKANGPLIGLNPSGLLTTGGYSGKNMFGLKSDYWQLLETVLEQLLVEYTNQILLVPHVFGPEDGESDVTACKEVLARFGKRFAGRVHYFPEHFDHHETKHLIGQCDFFLGSRMHACIAALSQCIPAVGLAYSRKFAGVMETVGDGAVVVDLRVLTLPEVAESVSQAWKKRALMRRSLVNCMPNLRRSVLSLCEQPEIQALLKRGQAT